MSTLKTNAAKLPTNYSTWVVAILMGVVAYWMQLPVAEQQALMTAYPWLKHAAPLFGLLAFIGARVIPQGGPPPGEPGETEPMGPP